MKIDMSEEAVTNRLKTVNQLRIACLSLSNSSAGKKIREQFSSNESIERTSNALGRCKG
jgi:hypothetical protein